MKHLALYLHVGGIKETLVISNNIPLPFDAFQCSQNHLFVSIPLVTHWTNWIALLKALFMMVGSLANTNHLSRWWSSMVLSVWTDMGTLGNIVSFIIDHQ